MRRLSRLMRIERWNQRIANGPSLMKIERQNKVNRFLFLLSQAIIFSKQLKWVNVRTICCTKFAKLFKCAFFQLFNGVEIRSINPIVKIQFFNGGAMSS